MVMATSPQKNASNNNPNREQYFRDYQTSISHPDSFWSEQAKKYLQWQKPWKKVSDFDFTRGHIRWFQGAKLNVCVNCVDRHLPQHQNKVAIHWESDGGHRRQAITYAELYVQVCQFANTLKKLGVKQGDVVCIYMPMIPKAIVAMLACSRIGAVHSVVFAGFSATALAGRIANAQSRFIITADDALRAGKAVPLKEQVDKALTLYPMPSKVLVVKNSGRKIPFKSGRDFWYHVEARQAAKDCEPVYMDAEDPLFILYTSGSTGKPKGVLHTQGGYLLYAAMTHQMVFDYHADDVYWCTADIGWITGHTYGVYGPFANAATSVFYEGVPTGPDPSLIWQIVDKYQINILYTAPTAIRALMAHGQAPLQTTLRDSLRILGTVGEPINPEAWRWYANEVGKGKCWVVDTWWQTETGGIMMVSLPGVGSQKPGFCGQPFYGVQPKILSKEGQPVNANDKGALVIEGSWPGQMRTIYGDQQRFIKSYFTKYKGYYETGDGAFQDNDGDYCITGRMDDVINISGHRIDTAEVESVLVLFPKVCEAAVIGIPHDIKGECLYAFVSLNMGETWHDDLEEQLKEQVSQAIGKFAKPEVIQWAPALPKTRSGKIMRRILRCIAQGQLSNLGDVSTLADPNVVPELIKYAKTQQKC